ncbi:Na+/H+ antiporter subunit E [Marinobacter orientalis]|uniref:Na+/H+ antiporter subunit E n=1 Tax=Marinobacter orientalis TaxID=1928859 RepID=A0A7Y0NIS8_9GAMM|nr:Na+/H+ antiporter subunit E [Marinobacter orientalis]NMT62077.1 Na+/H+ antiporter subunit E [Marinobacter orientalis]TGX50800.1 cation:proton antiporter [Marinobacter orientalis]
MALLRAFCVRAAAFFLVWWVLTEGDSSGLGAGAVIVLIVAWFSCTLYPPSSHALRPVGMLVFTGYFILRSVIAGLDVVRRLLSPSLPLNPGYLRVKTSLPEGGPRWLLANTLSLMPGTLSVRLQGTSLELHCLDLDLPIDQDVRAAERKVAGVFGLGEAGTEESAS